jgi:hypothetical protein
MTGQNIIFIDMQDRRDTDDGIASNTQTFGLLVGIASFGTMADSRIIVTIYAAAVFGNAVILYLAGGVPGEMIDQGIIIDMNTVNSDDEIVEKGS